jgi:hypothetical protein
VDNQPWSGEANVHVSIANWVKTQDAALLPKTRKLWFKVEPTAARKLRKRGTGPASKEYELDFRECAAINSALSDETDLSKAAALNCNLQPPLSFNGQMLGHEAFLLTADQRRDILSKDASSAQVIYPYLNGEEMLTDGRPDRFVLDFGTRNQLEAASLPGAFDWVRTRVLPDRERKAKEGVDEAGNVRPHHKAFLARWWQLSFGRPELISLIEKLPRYLVTSLVSKRLIFVFVSSQIRPSNLLQAFALADDYSFGILSSATHWEWFKQKSSKLTERYRFGEAVWNTFPWPQFEAGVSRREEAPTRTRSSLSLVASAVTIAKITAVAAAARELRRVRSEALLKLKGGLRALYRNLELPGANPLKDAHAALDAAVLAAYGFSAKKDLLAQLLELNLSVAQRLEKAEPVTPPGIPTGFPKPETLISDDCIRPPALA